jgi:hypothetical protein
MFTQSLPTKSSPVEDTIQNTSFLDWAPAWTGRKFNLIHCDFPYGINAFSSEQMSEDRHKAYDDSEDVYFQLLNCFCENLNKFMAPSAHLVFWFSAKHRDATMRVFREKAPSLVFYPYDLIWLKSCNSGVAGDAIRHPRHVYETALFAYRGARNVVKIMADGYSAPTDKKWHTSTKPEPVLKHFFTMLVDESTTLLDPTCGSGSSVRSAEALGAAACLGLEIDPEHCANARTALRQSRALRSASKEV